MTSGGEKRKFARRPFIAEIQYGSDSPVLAARISDISLRGLFIETINDVELGAKVTFPLRLPADTAEKPVSGEAAVTWSQPTVGMGMRFTRTSRSDWGKTRSCHRGTGG
jgi:hypothetical protein